MNNAIPQLMSQLRILKAQWPGTQRGALPYGHIVLVWEDPLARAWNLCISSSTDVAHVVLCPVHVTPYTLKSVPQQSMARAWYTLGKNACNTAGSL